MVLPLFGLVMGLVLGSLRAGRRRGARADLVQWALVHGMIGALLGLFALIFLSRALA